MDLDALQKQDRGNLQSINTVCVSHYNKNLCDSLRFEHFMSLKCNKSTKHMFGDGGGRGGGVKQRDLIIKRKTVGTF